MNDGFYRAFEDRFRGSRELIKARLRVYLPFVTPLRGLSEHAPCIDLGCGRGEWLELMREQGVAAIGVDLDDGMLQACELLKLNAHKAEALDFLRRQPDNSVALVSAFHLVEHVPFDALHDLAKEALRVLLPGGLLVMETPNPENIEVGTHTFYYDPTHQRPLPPLLLAFVPEFHGFLRTRVLRLQESDGLRASLQPKLHEVLTGASPDFAVVAQKAADAESLAAFDGAFEAEHGLTLNALADRYDAQVSGQVTQAIQFSEHAIGTAQQAQQAAEHAIGTAQQAVHAGEHAIGTARQAVHSGEHAIGTAVQAKHMAELSMGFNQQTQEKLAAFEQMLGQISDEGQRQRAAFEQSSAAAEQRFQALLNSSSWRMTAPLRWFATFLKRVLLHLKVAVRAMLLLLMRLVLGRPMARKAISSAVKSSPRLASRLHRIAIEGGLMPKPEQAAVRTTPSDARDDPEHNPTEMMTPRARQLHEALRQAIAKREKTEEHS